MDVKLPPAKWTVSGDEIYFIATSVSEDGGNRIVERERPYRDGAKLDDTGSRPRRWTVSTLWENTLTEDNFPPAIVLYPDQLNLMCASADQHETGDLQLPTRGKIRCRLQSYSRVEDDLVKGCAKVQFVFIQDNEDAIGTSLLSAPSARASIRQVVDGCVNSFEMAGSFSQFIESLESASQDLQEAIAAPGEALDDVDTKASRVIRACENIERQAVVSAGFATDHLSDPESYAAWRQLRSTNDVASRAMNEKHSGIGKIASIVTTATVSIFDIAVKYGQDPARLMDLNSAIEDFLVIPTMTLVRIFAK